MTTDVELDEKIKVTVRNPGKYKILFLNDDATPMQFVIELLMHVFKYNSEAAEAMTMTIHNEGAGVVGVYPFEIAEQKGKECSILCQEHNFPLKVKVERE